MSPPPLDERLTCPSLRWRAGSTATLLFTGTLAKIFLNIGARADIHGLDGFVKLLDERRDIEGRERGLLTGTKPSFTCIHGPVLTPGMYQYQTICPCMYSKTMTPRIRD